MTLAVAVLSLTRDRLAYTKHCFDSLHKFAGCDFDHYVLDQGSKDGTEDWLLQYDAELVVHEGKNIGVCKGLNKLLDIAFETDDYDVVVKFDNDCELTQRNTLRDVAQLVHEGGCLLSPRILGLRNPPQAMRQLTIGGEIILDISQIGGIFLASPGWVFGEFRYNETNPLYGLDDVDVCRWFRAQGGTCGYVKRLEAWHYESTDGQAERYPDYWARKLSEMAAANANVNAANTAVPHLFYASGGTKTAQDTFVYKDTRAGGIERFVYKGEVLPSGANAVTADAIHIK